IVDIAPLGNLTRLKELSLADNEIGDILPLAGLTGLTWLNLPNNQIGDIKALVDNSGLSAGAIVRLNGNPLSATSINIYIPELRQRGVEVSYGD
ncbi:MAG: leucine-rich repeat domain-containing protein, partial [Chloroflexi bacterium]|nr:leucine-rich repeat domain-containing protein [Chloroflexota bacterium]